MLLVLKNDFVEERQSWMCNGRRMISSTGFEISEIGRNILATLITIEEDEK